MTCVCTTCPVRSTLPFAEHSWIITKHRSKLSIPLTLPCLAAHLDYLDPRPSVHLPHPYRLESVLQIDRLSSMPFVRLTVWVSKLYPNPVYTHTRKTLNALHPCKTAQAITTGDASSYVFCNPSARGPFVWQKSIHPILLGKECWRHAKSLKQVGP